jgi:outer membrane protein OmpA-like peptidoglycan-associated protein
MFDTGQYSLRPGAREKLATVAGICRAYPGLNIEVGGYRDNVSGDDMSQKLSENRADSVRDYLVQQSVTTNSVAAEVSATLCRWVQTIALPAASRTGELNFLYPEL